jgi:DNA invertase Pin-like site-specific DNA recombinase
MSKRAAFYVRVSTADGQTTENQLRHLHEVANRLGWTVVAIFNDEGVSGSKGRDQRPGLDALMKSVARREFDIVAAWSVDRLGRSLPDLVGFLGELQARGVDLFLHQQAIDTSTPSGRMLYNMLAVFSEFERAMIVARVKAGLARTKKRLGRPPMPAERVERIKGLLASGKGIRETARITGSGTASVQRIKRTMSTAEEKNEIMNTCEYENMDDDFVVISG